MKLALAVVLLLAGPALGQAAYTVNVNAAEATALANERTAYNAAVCARMGVPSGCTQAAARNAFCVSVGLATNCTYAAARDKWCELNSALGSAPCANVPVVVVASTAEEVLQAKAQATIDAIRAAQRATQGQAMCGIGGLWRTKTRAGKDAICTDVKFGLGAGCDLCPN